MQNQREDLQDDLYQAVLRATRGRQHGPIEDLGVTPPDRAGVAA
jgi:hypothetical protein